MINNSIPDDKKYGEREEPLVLSQSVNMFYDALHSMRVQNPVVWPTGIIRIPNGAKDYTKDKPSTLQWAILLATSAYMLLASPASKGMSSKVSDFMFNREKPIVQTIYENNSKQSDPVYLPLKNK